MADQQAPTHTVWLVVAWLWAGVPLAWGIYQTLMKASALFQ